MGLKARHDVPKIKKRDGIGNTGCSSDQHPFFSFRYMTANAGHSAAFARSLALAERVQVLDGLYAAIERISSKPWAYWGNLPRKSGYETIAYSEIRFSAANDAKLTGDTKMNVFRFDTHLGTGKGRIIGFKDSPCSAFYVIWYDFDFSAYSH